MPRCLWYHELSTAQGGHMPNTQSLVTRDRDILGGTPVFTGTRVPIDTLFDYLAADQSLNDFLEDFPTVPRAHALALLNELKRLIATDPYARPT